MRAELQTALQAAKELAAHELPRLIGDLEEIRCTAIARLSQAAVPSQADELLDIDAAAKKLGISKDYIYRHAGEFSFTRRMGNRLRFSSLGIDRHIRTAKAS